MKHAQPLRDVRDAGMSLVELIVYGALSAVVLSIVALVFITSWQADAATRDRDFATGTAQTITSSIQSSIRSARWFEVTGDSLLKSRVAVGDGVWECRSWELSDGRVLHRVGAGDPVNLADIPNKGSGINVTGSFEKNGRQLSVSLEVQFGDASVSVTADAVRPAYDTEEAGECSA